MNTTTKKDEKAVERDSVKTIVLQRSQIKVRPNFNVRFDARTKAQGTKNADGSYGDDTDASSIGVDGFGEALASDGQISAIVVRPDPKRGDVYELIAGSRRLAALDWLMSQKRTIKGLPVGSIRAVVENKSDLEARVTNIAENTERDNLCPQDMIFGLMDLKLLLKASGEPATETAIALKIGKSQSYVHKLLACGEALSPEVFRLWREAPLPLDLQDMVSVSKMPPTSQLGAYEQACKAKGASEKKPDPRTDEAWIVKRCDEGVALGSHFADLIDCGFLPVTMRAKLDSETTLTSHVYDLLPKTPVQMKNGDEVGTPVIRRIAKAVHEGYTARVKAVADKAKADAEKPKTKAEAAGVSDN